MRQADAHEHCRGEDPVANRRLGVGKNSPHQERGGGLVELVVHEVHVSFVRKVFFAREGNGDRNAGDFAVGSRWNLALANELPDAHHRRLVNIEVDPHRVLGNDGGQDGLVRRDQVAARDQLVTDLPADGRGHFGPVEVETSRLQIRLGLIQGSDGLGELGLVLVHFRLHDAGELFGKEGLGAGVILLGQFEAGLVRGHQSRVRVNGGLIRPRIDLDEHLPFFDLRPILEMELLQVPRDPCPDLNRINSRCPPGVNLVIRDGALQRVADRDGRLVRFGRRHVLARAATQTEEGCKDKYGTGEEDG